MYLALLADRILSEFVTTFNAIN